ncbi:MAG: mechanosensitive ion channel [Bacteroidetes bacterium]|jgi:miniconductance mechanosensitive channel|nr:mechanosensitive ion channel [Bacteroidota bacterium]
MFEGLGNLIESWLLNELELEVEAAFRLKTLLLILMALLIASLIWRISKWVLNRIVPKITESTKTIWDDMLFSDRVLSSLALLIPVLFLDYWMPSIFEHTPSALPLAMGLTDVIIIFTVAYIVSSVFSSVKLILASNPDFQDKPIGSFTQLGNIFVYAIAFILGLSIIFDKSPVYLLSGFGAVAAVVLLVFKDSILGFVASVQLSANNMVHVGDWVTVPKYGADGDVLEINLTTIKVQNFDKTITTIPTYAFVSDSFTNWRGMQQSGGRRIKRSIHIKVGSIRFCSPEMVERFKNFTLVRPYLVQRSAEIEAHNDSHGVDKSVLLNGRRFTNIGVFRVYLEEYLKTNSKINPDMTIMVRQLASTPNGLPLEIYAFSRYQEWKVYEGIMADIFDHMFAAARSFDLEIFENPTGGDIRTLKGSSH